MIGVTVWTCLACGDHSPEALTGDWRADWLWKREILSKWILPVYLLVLQKTSTLNINIPNVIL